MPRSKVAHALLLASVIWLAPALAIAQFEGLGSKPLSGGLATLQTDVVSVRAVVHSVGPQRAELLITATIEPDWHIYSISQASGGPLPTQITLDPAPGYRVVDPPRAVVPPERQPEPLFNNLAVETHEHEAMWRVLLELDRSVRLEQLRLTGIVAAQACNSRSCQPRRKFPFVAEIGPPSAVTEIPSDSRGGASAGPYMAPGSHARITALVEPRVVPPGGTARVVFNVEPEPGWHVYALERRDPKQVSKPTLIVFTETSGFVAEEPIPSRQSLLQPDPAGGADASRIYDRAVNFTVNVRVPRTARHGSYRLAGLIGYQACEGEVRCDRPLAASFSGELTVGPTTEPGAVPLSFTSARYAEVAEQAESRPAAAAAGFDPTQFVLDDGEANQHRAVTYMLLGFLGGLILNLMPCVLPVIGLKILAFVEQANRDRKQILMLNVWYAAGIMAVFLVLASLPIVWQLAFGRSFTWGQQFGNDGFNIALAALIFAMALSLIGVWEIAVPGLFGSSHATTLASREGAIGAFAKGAVTTLLATPCSGPYLGTALGWALRQPPYLIYAVFASIGFGMASPYLLIGMFPRLIHFLPKPGGWMETFKELMGFMLLGTVVYILTFIHWTYVVPTITFLIALWAGCWWLGRTPLTAPLGARIRAFVEGAALAAAFGWFSFTWLHDEMTRRFENTVAREIVARGQAQVPVPANPDAAKHELPWQPFSKEALAELTREGRTVLVDFTADWCPNCKALEKFVLNTPDVKRVVEENAVVTLVADYTDTPPEITDMLAALQAPLIPVLAIFPAKEPNRPIVLKDGYSIKRLVDELRRAGPSVSAASIGRRPDAAVR